MPPSVQFNTKKKDPVASDELTDELINETVDIDNQTMFCCRLASRKASRQEPALLDSCPQDLYEAVTFLIYQLNKKQPLAMQISIDTAN